MITDFEHARTTMVDCQIRTNGVTSHKVINAFLNVPKEEFVSAAQRPLAYIDEDLPISQTNEHRFLMESMSMAKLIQLADITEECIVLDVGCGTGYSTAVLSSLGASVVAVECNEELCETATKTLMELGYDNAVVVNGPLEKGLASEGPFDAVFIGGAIDAVPQTILDQLKDGGRLVAVIGNGNSATAKLFRKTDGVIGVIDAFNCAVKSLPGFDKPAEFVF